MATVHIGRLRGAAGFSRTVAIKRLLPQYASNPELESLFVHEARLVARIQHPNVVATLDVVAEEGELILVMDYVQGEALSRLMQAAAARGERIPQPIALAIIRDALCGLHAAHEARDHRGEPLDIVHRDVSPQNVIVGSDGVARVLDFGVAKAATSVEVTREGLVRGKAAYMAPEQLFGSPVTRRADIYAVGVVLWEILVGERLFPGGMRPELAGGGEGHVASPCARGVSIDAALDAIVMRALAPQASERFETAQQMMEEVSSRFELASREEVADWVEASAGEDLKRRAALVARIESVEVSILPPPSTERRPALQSGDSMSEAALPAALSEPQAPEVQASSGFGRTALIAAVLAGLVGTASALWGDIFGAPTPGHSVAEPAPRAGPASSPPGVAALDKSAEQPFVRSGDDSAVDNRAGTTNPTAGAHGAVPAALSPAPGAAPQLPKPAVQPRKAAKAASKAGCKPPYTIDAAGRRHYKPHCF